jgi:methylated-DNA-[protein]-cysteine S-methyltransferase
MDLDQCSPFQRSVILAEFGVPRGHVTTYGRLARHLGAPRASRAAGRALATNPFPIVIPCHRAVRSDGSLGGYQGGVEMKARLLEMEGVQVERGRVLMRRVFY